MRRDGLQTRSHPRSCVSAGAVAGCVLWGFGVLAYLLLPGLHAFHTHAAVGHTHAHHVAGGHGHDHHHGHDGHEHDPVESPAHNTETCDVCCVFFTVPAGGDVGLAVRVELPAAAWGERVEVGHEAPGVATWAPDRRLRGPPVVV